MAWSNLTELFATYINALHILHAYRVLDGYGHLSVRNPNNASTFFMMRELAPAMVSGRNDIGEYRLLDAEPVEPSQPDAPAEKYIHSEILKRYQHVNVVLHGHADELIRSSITDFPLRAVIHTAPFLGRKVPVFDINKYYGPNDTQNLLVTSQRLGAALAAEFAAPFSCYPGRGLGDHGRDHGDGDRGRNHYDKDKDGGEEHRRDNHDDEQENGDHRDGDYHGNDHDHDGHHMDDHCKENHHDDDYHNDDEHHHSYPRHNLVLMQSHGFAAVATDLKTVTYEGIYAVTNARIQADAINMQHAYTGQAAQGSKGIVYLTEQQIEDAWETMKGLVGRPWTAWEREVRVNPLYVNELDEGY